MLSKQSKKGLIAEHASGKLIIIGAKVKIANNKEREDLSGNNQNGKYEELAPNQMAPPFCQYCFRFFISNKPEIL
ncbi:MAG TPA: hypothetical protein VE076_04600 [Nitrososphaeraceae archaeon]|nr:hypothetical protein [Nitrososphaeraceae archaeon]